jgi:hypothetical protein
VARGPRASVSIPRAKGGVGESYLAIFSALPSFAALSARF